MLNKDVLHLVSAREMALNRARLATICNLAIVVLIPVAARAYMQSALTSDVVFAEASIRPSVPDSHGLGVMVTPGGRFITKNATLVDLISFAYDLRSHEIAGGPDWASSLKYDIDAKPSAPVSTGPASAGQFRLMMRALLRDRFKLELVREKKELPVYVLKVDKDGPKFRNSGADAGPLIRPGEGGGVIFQKVTVSFLGSFLSTKLGRTVVDRTQLNGEYDFKLRMPDNKGEPVRGAPGDSSSGTLADPWGLSVSVAVREQLGLRLESEIGLVEIAVIVQVSRPLEN